MPGNVRCELNRHRRLRVWTNMSATTQFRFRKNWRELRGGRPGHRFTDRYRRAQESKNRNGTVGRIILIAVAVLCVAVGLVLTVIPGPAFVFFILAGGILATESRVVARFMDACEVFIRKVARWAERQWRRLPSSARIALVMGVASGAVAVIFLGYRFLRG